MDKTERDAKDERPPYRNRPKLPPVPLLRKGGALGERRNRACYCGSGRKFKNCCGKVWSLR